MVKIKVQTDNKADIDTHTHTPLKWIIVQSKKL